MKFCGFENTTGQKIYKNIQAKKHVKRINFVFGGKFFTFIFLCVFCEIDLFDFTIFCQDLQKINKYTYIFL